MTETKVMPKNGSKNYEIHYHDEDGKLMKVEAYTEEDVMWIAIDHTQDDDYLSYDESSEDDEECW